MNGACLTVTEFDQSGWFKVWLANETLDRTDLGVCVSSFFFPHSADIFVGEKKVGDQLNLERAMGAHVRFGGHFVQVLFP